MKNIQKKILIVPVPAVGHVNACIGLAEPLLKRGHRVAFFVEETFKGKLEAKGFEEFIYEPFFESTDNEEENPDKKKKFKNPGDALANMLLEKGILGKIDVEKQIENITSGGDQKGEHKKKRIRRHEKLKVVIEQFKPDLFIVDDLHLDPLIGYSDKPWIKNISVVPLLYLYDCDELPPSWTGFSKDSEKERWPKLKQMMRKMIFESKFNDTNEELGYKRYPDDICMPETQALTVYAFPEEYDYPQIKETKNWFNIDVFNKNENRETVDLKELVPKEFYEDDLDGKWSGKWIYVSMGSMGSVDLELMDRIIKCLAKTNHKYIVSKGPRHEEYKLERNMWGDRYLPQTKILPLVDLVITHGGNNSVTETFAQGKPMIIFPLFCDQHDNGQRLQEMNFAVKLKPYSFTEEELQTAIERLLNDDNLKQRITKASHRIQTSGKHEQFADLVDQILFKQDICTNGTTSTNGTNGLH